MRRILAIAALTLAISAVALSQTNNGQMTRRQTEQELIALSREFVDTSVGAIVVEMRGVQSTPSGPISVAEAKEQWRPFELEDTKVLLDGESAVVTGQVIFRGQSPEDIKFDSASSVKIHFLRREERWKLVSGCFGECEDK